MKILFVKLKGARGMCFKNGVILIDSRLKGEELFEVLVHEALHHANWSKKEKKIAKTARKIARVLNSALEIVLASQNSAEASQNSAGRR